MTNRHEMPKLWASAILFVVASGVARAGLEARHKKSESPVSLSRCSTYYSRMRSRRRFSISTGMIPRQWRWRELKGCAYSAYFILMRELARGAESKRIGRPLISRHGERPFNVAGDSGIACYAFNKSFESTSVACRNERHHAMSRAMSFDAH